MVGGVGGNRIGIVVHAGHDMHTGNLRNARRHSACSAKQVNVQEIHSLLSSFPSAMVFPHGALTFSNEL